MKLFREQSHGTYRGVCTVAEDRSPHGNPTAFRGANTRSGDRVGPSFPAVGISLTIAGEAARPCCYGKHGNREFLTRRVTGDEISEPAMSSRSRCLDGVVRGKYHYTTRRLIGCRDFLDDGGAAEALGHQWSERREEADLRGVEVRSAGFTQQAKGAPGPGGVGEHDAQLVVKSTRSAELAVAEALVEITAGCLAETGCKTTLARQSTKLDEVRYAQLRLDEPLQQVHIDAVHENSAGGKHGRGIDGRK